METTVRNIHEKINNSRFRGTLLLNEPMALHTTFRTGGPAELYLKPLDEADLLLLVSILSGAEEAAPPLFFLGGGANIVVSDRGIPGAVIDLTSLDTLSVEGTSVSAGAGCTADALAEAAARSSLSGAEFLAGMPGTVGGAVWMNARCYGSSISDILVSVRRLDASGTLREDRADQAGYGYKKSPYQDKPGEIILSALFSLRPGEEKAIREEMERHRRDREEKGHYRYPCAGSVFKNDRSLGAPTGVLLDSIGLKGLRVGGAAVADYHANIIINMDNATSADIRALAETCAERAKKRLKIDLEPEIRFVGDWSGWGERDDRTD